MPQLRLHIRTAIHLEVLTQALESILDIEAQLCEDSAQQLANAQPFSDELLKELVVQRSALKQGLALQQRLKTTLVNDYLFVGYQRDDATGILDRALEVQVNMLEDATIEVFYTEPYRSLEVVSKTQLTEIKEAVSTAVTRFVIATELLQAVRQFE